MLKDFAVNDKSIFSRLDESTRVTLDHAAVLNPASKEFERAALKTLDLFKSDKLDPKTILHFDIADGSGKLTTKITITLNALRQLCKVAQLHEISREYVNPKTKKTANGAPVKVQSIADLLG